jgi:hypothetical protein
MLRGRGQEAPFWKRNNNGAAATNTKALYFITNAAENSIVALKVASEERYLMGLLPLLAAMELPVLMQKALLLYQMDSSLRGLSRW